MNYTSANNTLYIYSIFTPQFFLAVLDRVEYRTAKLLKTDQYSVRT